MKRATELTLFTLTVATLTLAALNTAQHIKISLDAMAGDMAKTYLLNNQPKPIKIIQQGATSFPEVEYTNEDLETDK